MLINECILTLSYKTQLSCLKTQMLPSISVTPSSLNYASSQPMHLRENYLKPKMKDHELIPYGVPSNSQGFLQDFHHIDQFHDHVHGSSSSNTVFGVQTQTFDPFDNANCDCAPAAGYEVYEDKPFNGNEHAHIIDNFQYDGYSLNLPRRNQLDHMIVENQSYLPLNYVVPDEVSSITPSDYYQKPVDFNKNNRDSSISRRTFKVKKRSNIIKGQWTTDEDRLLVQLVEQYGMRKWSHIAQKLPGRIGKQCRERWHNHLKPDIKKDFWTDEEDKILIQAHGEIGNKWAEIAKRLPGRTENSIKNHWNATKRRQYSKRKCRSKYPRGTLLQEYIKSLNLDQNPPKNFRKKSNNANTKKTNTSTNKSAALVAAPTQPQIANQFCSNNDHVVPNYDQFNEVSDFCLDDNLFEPGCGIDSLLDDMSSVPNGKDFNDKGGMQVVNLDEIEDHFETENMMGSKMGIREVKKELDLVEMISQVNENIDV